MYHPPKFLFYQNRKLKVYLRIQALKQMRIGNELSMKDMISKFVDQNKLKPKLLEAQLIENWTKIVGEMIAKNTERIQVNRGQLIIHISSPAMRNELHYQRKTIAELVNKELNCDFIDDVLVK